MYLHKDEVKEGMTVTVDGGFTCMRSGKKVVYKDEEGYLYIECDEGSHYLAGCLDDSDKLIGITA